MEEIKIRPATKNDIKTLLRFEQGVIKVERPMDSNLKEDTYYYDLELLIDSPKSELLVAEFNGELIASGYARIEKSKHYLKHAFHSYLGFMYVVPEHRGKGINKLILDRLKKWSKQQGVMEMKLEVYHNNPGAIRAYEKAGFSKNLVKMRLDLSE